MARYDRRITAGVSGNYMLLVSKVWEGALLLVPTLCSRAEQQSSADYGAAQVDALSEESDMPACSDVFLQNLPRYGSKGGSCKR